jgi:hypothetical protein
LIGLFIFIQPNDTQEGDNYWHLKMIVYSNVISAICIVWVIFVPWKKGPTWYLRFSDKIFFSMILVCYLILPIANIGVMLYFIILPAINIKKLAIESYVVFFNVVCFMRIVEFITLIRKRVWNEARTYIKVKEE